MRKLIASAASAALVMVALVGVTPPASATSYTITATARSATVVVKKQLTIEGFVLPAKGRVVKSRKATVQQYRSGKWRTLTKAQIWSDGSYRAKVRFKTRGTKTLRIYKARTSESPAVATTAFKIRVVKRGVKPIYPGPTVTTPVVVVPPPPPVVTPPPPPPPAKAWTMLTTKDYVESGGKGANGFFDAGGQYTNGVFTANTEQLRLNGWTYPGDYGYADWTLDRRCEQFTARVGLDDDSHSSTAMRLQVLVDGTVAFTQDMKLGEHADVALPVNNALRVRLQGILITGTVGTGVHYANFGDAQIYCLT